MAALPSYLFFFLLLVGPLVLIHEFGHFAVAKLCGIKVVRFSFGFGPRLIGFRHGETDYRISLLPLGGYVKMAGDNPAEALLPGDEGRGYLEAPAWKRGLVAVAGPAMNLVLPVLVFFCIAAFTHHEGISPTVGAIMPGSPAEQSGMLAGDRVLSIDGKPIQVFEDLRDRISENANGALRIVVEREGQQVALSMVPQWIEESDDLETSRRPVIGIRPIASPATIGLLDPRSIAAKAGLQTFDRIVQVGGVAIDDQLQLQRALAHAKAAGGPVEVRALRGKALGYRGLGPGLPTLVNVSLPADTGAGLPYGIDGADLFIRWVIPGSPAARVGLRVGDRLLALDGAALRSWWGLEELLRKEQQTPIHLTVQSPGGQPHVVTLAQALLDLGESPITGIEVKALGLGLLHEGEPLVPTDQATPRDWVFPALKLVPASMTLGQAAEKSFSATWEIIRKEVLGILRIFQGRVSVKKLGGPIMIADVARQAAANGWQAFLFMMTLVSVNLGLVNLLPVPVLDGGHIVTALVETVQRKPLSRRAYELTNAFGLALLLALMVFVLVNDIVQKRGPGFSP